jgi:hypothetical protein
MERAIDDNVNEPEVYDFTWWEQDEEEWDVYSNEEENE